MSKVQSHILVEHQFEQHFGTQVNRQWVKWYFAQQQPQKLEKVLESQFHIFWDKN